MKIFTTSQIKELDTQTIQLEGITSIDLMDRAAKTLFMRIMEEVPSTKSILVMVGPGNNGGDALAVARLLLEAGYRVQTLLCNLNSLSADASVQLGRLQQLPDAPITCIQKAEQLKAFTDCDCVIEGLFGTGLNRPLHGFYADTADWLNQQRSTVFSIDLPGGLFGEDNSGNNPNHIVQADRVLGLQFPRLAFFLSENETYIGHWELVDIGIHPIAVEKMQTPYAYSLENELREVLRKRPRFSHKGTFGKGLLIAGSPGMMGAAVLSARGALRAGIGLLTVCVPKCGVPILQTAVPEVLTKTYKSEHFFGKGDSDDLSAYTAIALGPGIGTGKKRARSLKRLLRKKPRNLILDADALNLLSENADLLPLLPQGSILTPHPKEFDRMIGKTCANSYERLAKAREFAQKYQQHLILKGAFSVSITPDGRCFFNSTGNPGMATGGSGDVLTGIVVSLLAQGYPAEHACRLGTFLHGFAGDLALERQSQESLLASDIIEHLGMAFHRLKNRP